MMVYSKEGLGLNPDENSQYLSVVGAASELKVMVVSEDNIYLKLEAEEVPIVEDLVRSLVLEES